jgi:hypothetical protein
MSDDQQFRKLDLTPRPVRELHLLFAFLKGGDSYACELRDHGEFGVEAQFRMNGELYIARTFHDQPHLALRARDAAMRWAHRQRAAMENATRDGGSLG